MLAVYQTSWPQVDFHFGAMEIASSAEDHDSGESFEFKSCIDQIDLQEGLLFSSEAALDDEDDDESYIEISLEHNSSNDEEQDRKEDDETEEEDLDLRISFSSRSHFQQEATKVYTLNSKKNSGRFPNREFTQNVSMAASNNSPYTPSCSTNSSSLFSLSSSSSSTLNSSSNCNTRSSPIRSSEDVPCSPKVTSRWLSTQLPALKKMLNMLLLSLRESTEGKGRSKQNRHSASQASSSDWKLVVQSTKNSSSVTGSINGKIMKFFIKFKSVDVQSMLSNVKTPKSTSRMHTSCSTTPYDGRRKVKKTRSNGNGNYDLRNEDHEKSRSMEISMDAFKGVIEAMGMSFGRKDRTNAQDKSCPGSIKSSPMQQEKLQNKKTYRRENSIQGAIAHCKRSLNETPVFSS